MKFLVTCAAALLTLRGEAALVGYYPFEGNPNDVSGNGKHGVLSAVAPTLTAPGGGYTGWGNPLGQAYVFGGVNPAAAANTFVTVPIDINPAVTPQVTFGAWVKALDTSLVLRGIISHDNGNWDRMLEVGPYQGSERWCVTVYDGTFATRCAGPITTEWTFLVVRYDATNGVGQITIDGSTSAPYAVGNGAGMPTTTIGRNPNFDQPFFGLIDEVFFFDEYLTTEQVNDLRLHGVPQATVASATTSACIGLPAPVTVTVTGGQPPYTVTLSDGSSGTGPSPVTVYVTSQALPSYTVASVTDATGLKGLASGSSSIVWIPAPDVVASAADSVCPGGTGTASVVSTTPGVTYSWFITNEGGSASFVGPTDGPSVTFEGGQPGTVTVSCMVTAPNGCVNYGHQVVAVLPVPAPFVSAPSYAKPDATGLTATTTEHPGSAYQWSITNGTITSGTTGSSIQFTAGAGGVTTVSVVETLATGCVSAAGSAKVRLYASGRPCNPDDPSTLCLGQGRFSLQVSWMDYTSGATGQGTRVALTGDSGAFWFQAPANLELFVKVVDGTGVNGAHWLMYGALSDMEYTVTATDTLAGTVKTYQNAAHHLASMADVAAFPEPGARTDAFAVSGHEYGELAAIQEDVERSRAADRVGAARLPQLAMQSLSTALCTPDPATLCLSSSRFRVSVTWSNYSSGSQGAGQAVPLTPDAGVFWFFSPSNVELAVKVLDGTSVNGHFWVLWGALTDVEYTISVTDTETGVTRTYHNPPHVLASGADTAAF